MIYVTTPIREHGLWHDDTHVRLLHDIYSDIEIFSFFACMLKIVEDHDICKYNKYDGYFADKVLVQPKHLTKVTLCVDKICVFHGIVQPYLRHIILLEGGKVVKESPSHRPLAPPCGANV